MIFANRDRLAVILMLDTEWVGWSLRDKCFSSLFVLKMSVPEMILMELMSTV